jgi:hypothetical protein
LATNKLLSGLEVVSMERLSTGEIDWKQYKWIGTIVVSIPC